MTPTSALVPRLVVRDLVKRYANGVLANDGVSFEVFDGEIHAVVGENGAGKSTAMKMIYGLERPDAGEIALDGQPRHFASPAESIAAGIGLVPQHLQLVASMTVAENIVLGAEPVRGLWRLFDRRRAEEMATELAGRHGLRVDVGAVVGDLSAGEQQRVEILKALHRGARLLMLDEPTALLSPQEADELFASLRTLVDHGLTVVLITHKLNEVREVSDRFTVMRAGRVVGSGRSLDHTQEQMGELIVGHRFETAQAARVDAQGARPRVQVRHLSVVRERGRAELADISLDIAPGEILGIAGVEGNGQQRLADVLSGLVAPSAGTATIDGEAIAGKGVRHARMLGVGCVPEDRLASGAAIGLSVAENTAAADYFRAPASRRGLLDMRFIRERARALIRDNQVRCRDEQVAIGTLSGGNLQKVVVLRELQLQPRFLVAAQPTRGVDVGAAQGLRRSLVALRDTGASLLLISADLDELCSLADRIAVLYEGRLVAHFAGGQVSPRQLGLYMTGLAEDNGARATLGAPFSVAGGRGAA